MKKINNEIFREQACFDDLLTYSKVYLERKEWDKLEMTLQDMRKTVRTLRKLETCKQIYSYERKRRNRGAFEKMWHRMKGRGKS